MSANVEEHIDSDKLELKKNSATLNTILLNYR